MPCLCNLVENLCDDVDHNQGVLQNLEVKWCLKIWASSKVWDLVLLGINGIICYITFLYFIFILILDSSYDDIYYNIYCVYILVFDLLSSQSLLLLFDNDIVCIILFYCFNSSVYYKVQWDIMFSQYYSGRWEEEVRWREVRYHI